LAIVFGLATCASADVVVWSVPGAHAVSLEGKAIVSPGYTLVLRHRAGTLYFPIREVKLIRAPTQAQRFRRLLAVVMHGEGDATTRADQAFQAALHALEHDLPEEFHEAIETALALDPAHPGALRVRHVQGLMDAPPDEGQAPEVGLAKLLGERPMRTATSRHFVLLHDLPPQPDEADPPAEVASHLDLLERAYARFLFWFHAHGCPLPVPAERLKVILVGDEARYRALCGGAAGAEAHPASCWLPGPNAAVFRNRPPDEPADALANVYEQLTEALEGGKDVAPANKAQLIRLSRTLKLVVDIEREQLDLARTSREATRLVAASAGLARPGVAPAWLMEGLAAWSEPPREAAWAGMGAVHDGRLARFAALVERQQAQTRMEQLLAGTAEVAGADAPQDDDARADAAAEAWALTWFLLAKRRDPFLADLRQLTGAGDDPTLPAAGRQPFAALSAEGYDRLQSDWRAALDGLTSEVEALMSSGDP
jgi:hypothetical protein